MSLLFDYDVAPKSDPYIEIAETAIRNLGIGVTPGKFLVNVIPALRYIPEWFPGTAFHKFARETRSLAHRMLNQPIDALKARMVGSPHLYYRSIAQVYYSILVRFDRVLLQSCSKAPFLRQS